MRIDPQSVGEFRGHEAKRAAEAVSRNLTAADPLVQGSARLEAEIVAGLVDGEKYLAGHLLVLSPDG